MKHTKFSQEQISEVLRELKAGATAATLAECYGVTGATIKRWQQRERLRKREAENLELKQAPAQHGAETSPIYEAEADLEGWRSPAYLVSLGSLSSK